jgi:glycosyltransferase involved in cell wall biosynthesis
MRRVAQQCGAHDLLLWQGRRPHQELAAFMNAVDLLVLPSHAEGVPNVVLEALACGTPVVATAVGGIPEVLHEAAGALVPARDITALANAMAEVLERPFDRAAIRAEVAHLSWPASAAQLADVLRAAAAGVAATPMP